MLKILISDHYTIFRVGLIQIVLEAFPQVTIEEANDADSLLKKVSGNKWDVILFGLAMKDDEDIRMIRKLKRLAPGVSIVICGTQADDQRIRLLLKAGASGYVDKGARIATVDELLKETLSAKVQVN